MAIKVLPYKMGSVSSRDLARALGVMRIKLEGSRYRPRQQDQIINWGNCGPRALALWAGRARMWNKPSSVEMAHNKLNTYRELNEIPEVRVPEYTTDREEAAGWTVPYLARTLMSANSGRGITMCAANTVPPHAPLYVKYCKKRYEYRVHVAFGVIIDVQQKRPRRGMESNFQVRSYDNGWVFCRQGIIYPRQALLDMAVTAVRLLGLDFGAVDIGWNQRHQQATIYEVNTAPGMEGQTLVNYVNAFRRAA